MMKNAGLIQPQRGVLGVQGFAVQGKLITADSRVLYVQPNHPKATDLGNLGMVPEIPFRTVQAAINSLSGRDYRGDVIFVGGNDGWTYGGLSTWDTPIVENVIVDVGGLSIIGVSSGLGVYWTSPVALAFCLTVQAIDVYIEGFSFMGGAGGCNGIYAEWAGGTTWFADNIIIRNCSFDDQIDIAIQLEYVWYGQVYDCFFEECDTFGIYVDPAGSGIARCRIGGNSFHDVGAAMGLNGADDNQVFNNSIYVTAAQGGGAATNRGIDTTLGQGNQVFDNYFSCLLPVAAPGDYNDLNTAGATDAWINNHCMNGLAITNPT